MKIQTKKCSTTTELENFLNEEINYNGFCAEHIILGITHYDGYYTVIYKDFNV